VTDSQSLTAPGGPAALEQLATALGREFSATLIIRPGHRTRLDVTCRHTKAAGGIYTDDSGWYWWDWNQCIAATNDPLIAAHRVAAALRGRPPAGGQR
jgi:hypothetical protein